MKGKVDKTGVWPTILCGLESVTEHKKADQVLRFSLGMTQLYKIRHEYGGLAVHETADSLQEIFLQLLVF